MIGANELPKGWAKARVDALMQLVNGFAFKPTQWKSEGLPIIRIQNLNNPDAPFNYCPENLPEKIRVRNGDLLFAWSGTPGTSFGAHIWRGEDAWLNQHIFKVLFDRRYLDERFLRLAINQNLDSYIRQAHGGAGLAHITKGRFEESELSIAPVNEQRRIVARIEELFSDLDAGVAALERAKANLKRYRASVLKAAVEGKLTEEWRAKHPNTEPASKLLERILAERRQKWEADQLTKFAAAGKQPPKNWKEKYVEPTPPDTTGLPELPKGWCWATWHQVLAPDEGAFKRGPFGSALTKSIFVSSGYKVYEQYCPINDDCSFARYYVTSDKYREMESFAVQGGDYLISCSGVTLGRITQVPQEFEPGIINQAILRVRINDNALRHHYFLRLFRSPFFQRQILENSTGSAIPNVKGVKELKSIRIPLPPIEEQEHLAFEIDETLSQIAATETQIDDSLRRAARLRQGILKHAFEGKLVPQDPSDEPASALLERIQRERSEPLKGTEHADKKEAAHSKTRGRGRR